MTHYDGLVNSNRLVSDRPTMDEPLPPEEALRFAASLAEALRRLHREGGVCGALDPDRIVWNKGGAKLVAGTAAGATAYWSPEQVRGEALDTRSDIFSFGAIFYEMLAGHKAFAAPDSEELKREILERTPAPLAGVPDEMANLVFRCLAKRREDRWQRINSVLIEMKLAQAQARQAQSAGEWRDRVSSLRSQLAGQEERLTAHAADRQTAEQELRQTIQEVADKLQAQGLEIGKIQEAIAAIHEAIGALQKDGQSQARTIEGLEAAASQTDEVVEHVVEAFGMMHRSLVERGEAKVLLVSRNGS